MQPSLERLRPWVIITFALGLGWLAASLLGWNPLSRLFAPIQITGSGDFGEVAEGRILMRSFEVQNMSGRPITISSVRSGCGCTTAALAPGTVLNPGERVPFDVRVDTVGRAGRFGADVSISHAGSRMPAVVRLKANVNPVLIVEHGKQTVWEAHRGDLREWRIPVHWVQPGLYEVTEVRVAHGHVKASIRRLEDRSRYEIVVRPDTSQTKPLWKDRIILKTTCPDLPEREIDVCGLVDGYLRPEPKAWMLGTFSVAEKRAHNPALASITLRLEAPQPFRVLRVATESLPGLECQPVQVAPDAWTLRFHIESDRLVQGGTSNSIIKRTVRVETDLQGEHLEWPILGILAK
jgi:hypothetical protein